MDAGGCGWSAQRMLPTGPAAVQRDFDGTPMATDVMHDDTCRAFARVLGRRNEGFMQMLLVSGDNRRDRAFYEEMAELSGRPMLMNVVQAFDHRPDIHRRVLAWLESCRMRGIRVIGQGLTTDAGFNFTFEDWNLFDDSQAWCEATTGSREERKRKLADPARRQALKDDMPITATGPLPDIVIVGPKLEKNARWEDHTLAIAGEKMGRHPVDVMLDMAVEEDLATEFFAAPPNGDIGHLREIVDNPYVLFGVSDGGAHTKFLTAGRYPTETLCKIVREHEMSSLEEVHWRLSALPAMVAGFDGARSAPQGRPRRHRGLRLRTAQSPARRGDPRPSGRGVAPRPACRGLPLRARQRRGHHPRRPGDGDLLGPAPSPTATGPPARSRRPLSPPAESSRSTELAGRPGPFAPVAGTPSAGDPAALPPGQDRYIDIPIPRANVPDEHISHWETT